MSLRRGIIASQSAVPPPVVCTAELSGDLAAGLPGAQAADISGLAFSKSDSAGLFLAGSPVPAGFRPPPASGIAWVAVGDFAASGFVGSNSRAGFAAFDGAGNLLGALVSRGNAALVQTNSIGADIGQYEFNSSPFPVASAIGIDSDGYIHVRDKAGVVSRADGLTVIDGTPTGRLSDGGSPPALIALLGVLDLTGGAGSASGKFWVAQAEMDLTGLAGEDWCGNSLPDPPAPSGVQFDPARTEGTLTISEDGKAITGNAPWDNNPISVLGKRAEMDMPKSSGAWQFEVEIVSAVMQSGNPIPIQIGVSGVPDPDLTNCVGFGGSDNAPSAAIDGAGIGRTNKAGSQSTNAWDTGAMSVGDIVTCCISITGAGAVLNWYHNGLPSNPSSMLRNLPAGFAWRPAVSLSEDPAAGEIQLRVRGSGLTYEGAGYQDWDTQD